MNAARHAVGLAKKDGTALTAVKLPSLYGWSPAYAWQKKYTNERKKMV
jgi:hypothetical protein